MRTNKCEKCNEKFEVVEIGGGQPFKPESGEIKCPSCGHLTWEKTTGYFVTNKIPRH